MAFISGCFFIFDLANNIINSLQNLFSIFLSFDNSFLNVDFSLISCFLSNMSQIVFCYVFQMFQFGFKTLRKSLHSDLGMIKCHFSLYFIIFDSNFSFICKLFHSKFCLLCFKMNPDLGKLSISFDFIYRLIYSMLHISSDIFCHMLSTMCYLNGCMSSCISSFNCSMGCFMSNFFGFIFGVIKTVFNKGTDAGINGSHYQKDHVNYSNFHSLKKF